MKITPEYLAGMMDADGYFGIIPFKRSDKIYFHVNSKLTQTEAGFPVIDYLHKNYGGWVSGRKNKNIRDKPGHSDSKQWELRGTRHLDFLYDIRDHMIVKRRQVDILIQYIELPRVHPNYGDKQLYEEVRGTELILREELAALHASKGRSAATTKRVEGGNA